MKFDWDWVQINVCVFIICCAIAVVTFVKEAFTTERYKKEQIAFCLAQRINPVDVRIAFDAYRDEGEVHTAILADVLRKKPE